MNSKKIISYGIFLFGLAHGLLAFSELPAASFAFADAGKDLSQLVRAIQEPRDFTLEERRQLQSLTYPEEMTLFELYGNPAFDLNRVKERLHHAQATPNGSFRPSWFLIPGRLLEVRTLDPQSIDKLVWGKRDNEVYFRWFLHPEDVEVRKRIRAFLLKNGESAEVIHEGTGWLTSSRTCLVSPGGGRDDFYVKSSIAQFLGAGFSNDRDKTVDLGEGIKSFVGSQAVARGLEMDVERRFRRQPERLTAFEPMLDAAYLGIRELNLATVLRLAPKKKFQKMFYVPAFSVLHRTLGPKLAKLNGNANPLLSGSVAGYWEQHLVQPMGRAIAELLFTSGLISENPHSQNYVLELDENFAPTGKVLIRDFADSLALRVCKNSLVSRFWTDARQYIDQFTIRWFILFHGSKYVWASEEMKEYWRRGYFKSFLGRFSELIGIPQKELEEHYHVNVRSPQIQLGQLKGVGWEHWLPSCDGTTCGLDRPCNGFVLDKESLGNDRKFFSPTQLPKPLR